MMNETHVDMNHLMNLLGIELSAVSVKEKCVSLFGGIISIFCLILLTEGCLHLEQTTAIVASMGASAVLLFGIPHGPLSQPWPVIAGHGFSALIGVTCARWLGTSSFSAALAVGVSIGVMHQLRCIHPPGGATALTAVLGGPAIHHLGFGFVLLPVLVNGIVMVGIAMAFNFLFGWRRYPAAFGKRHPAESVAIPDATHEAVLTALRDLDSFVDVSEEDLVRIYQVMRKQGIAISETP